MHHSRWEGSQRKDYLGFLYRMVSFVSMRMIHSFMKREWLFGGTLTFGLFVVYSIHARIHVSRTSKCTGILAQIRSPSNLRQFKVSWTGMLPVFRFHRLPVHFSSFNGLCLGRTNLLNAPLYLLSSERNQPKMSPFL